MPTKITSRSRRRFLKHAATAAGVGAAASLLPRQALAQPMPTPGNPAEKLLFVITASGGACVTDSWMAVGEGEVPTADPETLICYPDADVVTYTGGGAPSGQELRSLNLSFPNGAFPGNGYQQTDFLTRHGQDVACMTCEGTSVNHLVAQERAVTGFNANAGLTLGEAMAMQYGQNLPLANVNMGQGGYLRATGGTTVPGYARGETVASPATFSLAADGIRGMVGAPGAQPGAAPQVGAELSRSRDLMTRIREVRGDLETSSVFAQTFQCSEIRDRFLDSAQKAGELEDDDVITKLMHAGGTVNLGPFGLSDSPDAAYARSVVETMPDTNVVPVVTDPLLSQVVLAYLLAKNGLSCALTLGVSLGIPVALVPNPALIAYNPPLSFDFSHSDHVMGQRVMWMRTLDAADKLITMLKDTPVVGGGTMWDRSLVYIATDFGRDKVRSTPGQGPVGGTPSLQLTPQFTGHHLNNGVTMVSPLLNGGRKYGGINKDTLLTYGFDPLTGAESPSTVMREQHVYSAIMQALGVSFPNQIPMDAMVA